MEIANQRVVYIHYTLTNDAGEVLDSSRGAEPLAYLHGGGNIIPGLENALAGKSAGDKLVVKVAPAEGYGERNDELVQNVPRRAFQGIKDINTDFKKTEATFKIAMAKQRVNSFPHRRLIGAHRWPYSPRSAVTGSIRAARPAGIAHRLIHRAIERQVLRRAAADAVFVDHMQRIVALLHVDLGERSPGAADGIEGPALAV